MGLNRQAATAQDNVDGAKTVQIAMHEALDSMAANRSGSIVQEIAAEVAGDQLASIDDLVAEYERDVTTSRRAVRVSVREHFGSRVEQRSFEAASAAEAWLDQWSERHGKYPAEVRWS